MAWLNMEDVLFERNELRDKVIQLEAENLRLRSALVEEVRLQYRPKMGT